MPLAIRSIATSLVALSLTGCAINALRLEGASQVTLAANTVVTQGNAALDAVKIHRQKALVSLIASDPNCPPVGEIYVFVPTGPPDPNAKPPPLCAKGKDDQLGGYRTRLLHFNTVSSDRLKPTVLMISAIAEYAGALKEVTDRPNADVSKILASAAQKAADAKAIADAVFPGEIPDVPSLETKQAKSAIALVQFFVNLAEEASKAKNVGRVYAIQSSKIQAILGDLKTQVSDWNDAATASYAEIDTDALRRAYTNERGAMTFEARRSFLELIQQSETEKNGVKRVSVAFAEAVDNLESANVSLGKLLRGELTPEQRAREQELNETRIFKALKLAFDAATSWGVL